LEQTPDANGRADKNDHFSIRSATQTAVADIKMCRTAGDALRHNEEAPRSQHRVEPGQPTRLTF
jgi:hypothetical protein